MGRSSQLRTSLAAAALICASALQFDVDAGRTKCIGEVMGKHEVAKGSYSIEGMAEGMQSGFTVTITGPANEKEFSQVDAVSGKFAFTASDAGAHKVCFVNNGPVSRRVAFDFSSGVGARDYAEIAKKEHLQPLELEMRKLEDRVDSIHREMMYQREREETHRNTNESTNTRVVWYSLATIFAVLAVSLAQVWNMYSYLRERGLLEGSSKRQKNQPSWMGH